MTTETVKVPDVGDTESVEVIEVIVGVGDNVELEQSLIVLESDKASMEVPSPAAGKITKLHVKEGATVNEGDAIADIELADESAAGDREDEAAPAAEAESEPESEPETPAPVAGKAAAPTTAEELPKIADAAVAERQAGGDVHAGPAVRKLARELGVDLSRVTGSGPKSRILTDDVHNYIKAALESGGTGGASALPAVPDIDFTQFGSVDQQPLSKLHKLTAQNMARSWLNVPHVTHFDDADITELEDFRAGLKPQMQKRGVKLSPLPFIVKACAVALRMNPAFNASLLPDGEQIAYKQYYHIGLAVDTPAGLMVPVLRDVDRKSIWEIAEEMTVLSTKARDRKLSPADMQGACFTVSSLGNIGGIGFTPIVNTPEVGILGVSRTTIKPVYINGEFVPRKVLPLSLSYDHRAVNGAHAGRFITELCQLMADIRRQLL